MCSTRQLNGGPNHSIRVYREPSRRILVTILESGPMRFRPGRLRWIIVMMSGYDWNALRAMTKARWFYADAGRFPEAVARVRSQRGPSIYAGVAGKRAR